MRQFGPAANNAGEWVEWADRQTHDPAGKIFKWPARASLAECRFCDEHVTNKDVTTGYFELQMVDLS